MTPQGTEKGAWPGMTIAILLIVMVGVGLWLALGPYRT
jgi:hypothetical protein